MRDSRSTHTLALPDTGQSVGPMHQLELAHDRLRTGDDSAVGELVDILERGTHFFLRRAIGEDRRSDGIVMRILLRAAERARDRQFADARAICRYVLGAVRAAASAHASRGFSTCTATGPTAAASGFEVCLTGLGDLEREALRRYYLQRHDPGEICADLGLSREHFDGTIARLRRTAVRETRDTQDAASGASA